MRVSALMPTASLFTSDAGMLSVAAPFLPAEQGFMRPGATISAYRRLLTDQMVAGAEHIRMVGEVPHPGVGVPWGWWGRFEAALNRVLEDVPVSMVCLYDARITPDDVLEEVACTHPYLASVAGRYAVSGRYQAPEVFLGGRHDAFRYPFEAAPPDLALDPATSRIARHAAATVCAATQLPPDDVDGLLIALSEAVADAHEHGRPPVHVRLWAQPQRVVAPVTDGGDGPKDPFAGLQAPAPRRCAAAACGSCTSCAAR